MAKGKTTEIVRELNLDIIRKTLRETGVMTKAEISRKTGLSIPTCTSLLDILQELGEVKVEDRAKTGGRPAKKFCYVGKNESVLCMYILTESKSHLICEVLDFLGNLQERQEFVCDDITAAIICIHIERVLSQYSNIKAISIGIPGYVVDGTIDYCDAQGLIGVNLEKIIKTRFNINPIIGAEKLYKAIGYRKRTSGLQSGTLGYVLAPKGQPWAIGILTEGGLKKVNGLIGELMYFPYAELEWNCPDKESCINQMAKLIAMLTVIALDICVIANDAFEEKDCEKLIAACKKIIPEKYIPEILYSDDMLADYRAGLLYDSLSRLQSGLELIEV